MSHSSHMNGQSFASWRSVLIGALLIPLNSYWHIQMTLVWLMNFPAILTLLFNVVFLLLLVAGNRLWAQYSSHNALRQSELHIYHVIMYFYRPLRLRYDAVLGLSNGYRNLVRYQRKRVDYSVQPLSAGLVGGQRYRHFNPLL